MINRIHTESNIHYTGILVLHGMFRRHLEFLKQRRIRERNHCHQVGGSKAEEMRGEGKEKYVVFSFLLVPFPPNIHPTWLLDRILLHRGQSLSAIGRLHRSLHGQEKSRQKMTGCVATHLLCNAFMTTSCLITSRRIQLF